MASTLERPETQNPAPTSIDGQGLSPQTSIRYQPRRKGLSPYLVLAIFSIFMVGLLAFGIGSSVTSAPPTPASSNDNASSSSNTTTSGMNMGSSSTDQQTQNIPNATQEYGGQPAQYTIDADGAKHFHFTAKEVMWLPVKGGQRVHAYTINGTVPGPAIRITANDHIRVTLTNNMSQSTSLHWHGLMLPSDVDGVPGVGQKPIQPGQTYTYDFTVHDQDVGTHWYHSHDNDMVQVPGGLYGAFIVDPRPGTSQAAAQPKADVEYTEFISEMSGYYVVNGKSFPDTQPILLKHGQTVHIRMINAGEMMHPMHLHGHFFNIVAEDGHLLAQSIQKDTLPISPGETYDLTFYGWASPGSIYPFHCHILSHVMNPGQSGDEMGGLIVLVEYAKK